MRDNPPLERGASWVGRAAAVALTALAARELASLGRVASCPPPPAPTSEPAPGPKKPDARLAETVDLLIDRLDQSRYIAPKLEASLPGFRAANWRGMNAPYARVTGPARKAVQVVAFTVGAPEKPLDPEKKTGLGSQKELRTWNVAEASFDAREALLAPPPCSLRVPLRVPAEARLEVAPAVVNPRAGSVTFEVAVRPRGGERQVLDSYKLRAEQPTWHDRSIDLSAFAGREVELELTTETTSTGDPPAALWGAPAVVAPSSSALPYNIVWFVIDTMRPDALAAWHDPERDRALAAAPLAPLEAWLPAMPTVAPRIDAIAQGGAAFVDATSAATWTRPGTLGMLAGSRSSQLGLDTTPWILPASTISKFYASDPPLLPLLLRKSGVRGQAFVNNFFLSGYARAGVDPGFVGVVDHRHETLDTGRIVRDATRWIEQHKRERFLVFVNLNSPHSPYSPPSRFLDRVPRPPLGPKEKEVRAYLGEIAKDDDGVGQVIDQLDGLGLRDNTLVVVTADHGETLSREHSIIVEGIGEQAGATRYHHANAMFEETTRVPLIFSLPGRIAPGTRVPWPTQNIDIVPTILALEGLTVPDKVRGQSLVPLLDGRPGDPDRPILSEGRAARSIRIGRYRYVERDPAAQLVLFLTTGPRVVPEELYDLQEDPGERRDIAQAHPEIVARLREKLAEALSTSTSVDSAQSAALAGSRRRPIDASPPSRVHLRFVSAGRPARIRVTARLPEPERGAPAVRLLAAVVGGDPAGLRLEGLGLDASFTTLPDDPVGLDLEISPAGAPLSWELEWDDAPLAPDRVFAGPFGLAVPALSRGLLDPDARLAATADAPALIDPRRDSGAFVTREPLSDLGAGQAPARPEALREVKALLETWGYAAPSRKP